MAPGVGGVGKAVQQEDEWTFTLFKIRELEVVSADALHSVFLSDDRSHAAQPRIVRAVHPGVTAIGSQKKLGLGSIKAPALSKANTCPEQS